MHLTDDVRIWESAGPLRRVLAKMAGVTWNFRRQAIRPFLCESYAIINKTNGGRDERSFAVNHGR